MQDFSQPSVKNISEQKLDAALYVVATPIGNLKDITFRALEVLEKSDFIVCEDSRVTIKILRHYKLPNKKLIIYNDHCSEQVREKILNHMIQGSSVALVSDAGTPLISDPGYKLIQYLREYNQKIIPIPGASSVISALCASGLACDNFLFLGFLPNTKMQKINLLKTLPKNFTSIFFESANRIPATLEVIHEAFGQRKISLARELTKIHEEILTDEAENLSEYFIKNPQKLRGEFVLIIEKSSRGEKNLTKDELSKEIENAISAGCSIKELSQNLADIYDLNKKEIYQMALQITKK